MPDLHAREQDLPSLALHHGTTEMKHERDCWKRTHRRRRQTDGNAARRVGIRDLLQTSSRDAQAEQRDAHREGGDMRERLAWGPPPRVEMTVLPATRTTVLAVAHPTRLVPGGHA